MDEREARLAAVRRLAQSRSSSITSPATLRAAPPPASPVHASKRPTTSAGVRGAAAPEVRQGHGQRAAGSDGRPTQGGTRSASPEGGSDAVRKLALAAASRSRSPPPVTAPQPQPAPEPEPEPQMAEEAAVEVASPPIVVATAQARRATSASLSSSSTIDHGALSKDGPRYTCVASGESHLAMIDSRGRLHTTAFGTRDRVTAFGRRPETYGELGCGRPMWSHRKRELTREKFQRYDSDGDGEISKQELRSMLEDLDMRVGEDYLTMALQHFDTDQSGFIEFDEFEKLFSFLKTDGVIAPQPVAGPLSGRQVVQVACGDQHTAAVADDGTLWTFGRGGGRLGLKSLANTFEPCQVGGDLVGEHVVSASCGEQHTAVRTQGGTLYTFGGGSDGQLGHGDGISCMQPKRVGGALDGKRITRVACGSGHVAVVVADGQLFTFGRGGGRLGHAGMDNGLSPKLVDALSSVVVREVACGAMHTAVVCENGALYTFGRGSEGQLGHGGGGGRGVSRALLPTRVDTGDLKGAAIVGVDCGDQHTAALTLDARLVTFGLGDPVPTRVVLADAPTGSRGDGISKFSCGQAFTAVLRDDGHLFTVGHTPNPEGDKTAGK
jgi:alpha-tubulin suppressor-like RCC1 family protein